MKVNGLNFLPYVSVDIVIEDHDVSMEMFSFLNNRYFNPMITYVCPLIITIEKHTMRELDLEIFELGNPTSGEMLGYMFLSNSWSHNHWKVHIILVSRHQAPLLSKWLIIVALFLYWVASIILFLTHSVALCSLSCLFTKQYEKFVIMPKDTNSTFYYQIICQVKPVILAT